MQIQVVHTLHPEVIALIEKFFGSDQKTAPVKKASSNGQEKTPVVEMKQEASSLTIEEVRKKVQELQAAGKRADLKKLLTEFGAEKVTSLAPDQYSAFYQRLNAIAV